MRTTSVSIFLGLLAAVAAAELSSAPATGHVGAVAAPNADFRRAPPRVKGVTARRAANGGTLVRVQLAPDARLGKTLTLAPGEVALTLRDDGAGGDERAGDGLYSTVLPIAFDAAASRQATLLDALGQRGIVDAPVFEGRAQVGRQVLDDLRIRNGTFGVLSPGVFASLVQADRSLLITDPAVLTDPARTFDPCTSPGTGNPDGVWTFKHLMEGIANQSATGIDPEAMARDWFSSWSGVAFPGTASSIWPASVDLAHAPFRLVAIVNRIDRASSTVGYGGLVGGDGGEGRLVFQTCTGVGRMVIFEYGVPLSGCVAVRDWAQRWLALGALVPGSDAYDAALEALTEAFVRPEAAPGKPNGSALNQLRTDAFASHNHSTTLDNESWNLHEWHVQADGEGPTRFTIAQTPSSGFNGTAPLGDWINLETPQIVAGTYLVGNFFDPIDPSRPFLANGVTTSITTSGGVTTANFWNAPGIMTAQARHLFSLGTCDGCHVRETNTHFRHLGDGIPPSGFLTGIDVQDPVVPTIIRHFDDLSRRAGVLSTLASSFCLERPPNVFTKPPFLIDPTIGPVMLPLPPIWYTPVNTAH